MYRYLPLVALIVFVGGCAQDSHLDVTADYVKTMDEVCQWFETIDSAEAIEEKRPQLSKLLDRLKSLEKRSGQLGEIDQEMMKKIERKYGSHFSSLNKKFQESMTKIESSGLKEELESELKTLASLLKARV